MDYSSLNSMLNNLEVNQSNTTNLNTTNLNNTNYVDNKKVMTNALQRDINLEKKQPNFELVNPQRDSQLSGNQDKMEYKKFDEGNTMINNYNFAYSQRTINPNQFIDFTKINSQEIKDKNNINDRLNNRGFTPASSNKFFS